MTLSRGRLTDGPPVAEDLHDHPRVHAGGQQQRRGGVPSVVQPDVPHAGLAQAGLSRCDLPALGSDPLTRAV